MDRRRSRERPHIGLTTYWQQGRWGVWDDVAAIAPSDYVRAVAAAGGVPILLPPHGGDASVVDVLDGLVVIGGADVDPSRYGAQPHERTVAQPDRDEHEDALIRAALDRGVPLFAICRGAQVLNVVLGGSLHQHLPEVIPGAERYQPAPGEFGEVEFTTEPGSLAERILGPRACAPCYHHQGVDRLGDGLVVTARADDGTVEILELPTAPGWVLGVQFHPEHDRDDLRLFEAFIAAARAPERAAHHPTSPNQEAAS